VSIDLLAKNSSGAFFKLHKLYLNPTMYSWNLNGADQFKLNPSKPSTAVSLTDAEIVY
jgi:hypothetical protein